MASISNDPGGHRRILFIDPDGKRRAFRLGKVPKSTAAVVRLHVEALLSAKITGGALDRQTALWVKGLEPKLRARIERAGLLEPIEAAEPPKPAVVELKAFVDDHIAKQKNLKPSTVLIRNQVRDLLVGYFGADRDVTTITPGDADDFQQSLVNRGLASSTIAKRIQVARSYFRALKRHKKIAENPFSGIRATAATNADRMRFIERQDIEAVLEKCPNHHWRVIVALSRYGGLRCPSEVLSLKWTDIDWAADRFTVTSPKTEHHQDGHVRVVPIFPELRPYLAESLELAPEGAVYVVAERYRKPAMTKAGWANANLRTQLTKIIERAGLEPWPKLFQNLRVSRETELAEEYPIHVVTKWLGNSPKVALRHYLMATEAHFQRATGKAAQKAAHETRKVAQKAAQRAGAGGGKPSQKRAGKPVKNGQK